MVFLRNVEEYLRIAVRLKIRGAHPSLAHSLVDRMRKFAVGDWRADAPGNRIERNGVVVRLEPKAMALLCCLAANSGEVVARATLLDSVWAGQVVEDDALSAAVIKLRKAMGDSARAPRYIETIPKRGYRLIATVQLPDSVDIDSGQGGSPGNRPAIAVLPFENLSGDPEQRYLADGMSEDIITALSRVRTFQVTARNSSFAFREL